MDHRKIIGAAVAVAYFAAPFAPDDGRKKPDDAPKGALASPFLASGTLTSSSSSAVTATPFMMMNTVEGEDFSTEPLIYRRPAAGITITVPSTARSYYGAATLSSGPVTPVYLWPST